MSRNMYNNVMPLASRLIIKYHRVHRYTYTSENFLLRRVACRILSAINQLVIQPLFHCVFPKEAQIGENFMLPHPFGVLVAPDAIIGSNVKILHHVTLGHNELSDEERGPMIIGNNVYIGPGAQILGNRISIGDGAVIGPNAVVVRDVPADAVMVGIPARNIGQLTMGKSSAERVG